MEKRYKRIFKEATATLIAGEHSHNDLVKVFKNMGFVVKSNRGDMYSRDEISILDPLTSEKLIFEEEDLYDSPSVYKKVKAFILKKGFKLLTNHNGDLIFKKL